jgi:hypothetical protein
MRIAISNVTPAPASADATNAVTETNGSGGANPMNDGIDIERCAKCSYSAYNGTLGVHCEYILIAGKMRGCEPGKACDKFTTEPVKREEEEQQKGYTGEGKPRPG